ncbi:MAG: hypothetical protein ACHQCE_12670, partial [Streptosporangiales bacterium]
MRGTPWNWPPGTATGSSYSAPGHRYFEFYRSHGDSIVPLLKVDDLDEARPSWIWAALACQWLALSWAPGVTLADMRGTGGAGG